MFDCFEQPEAKQYPKIEVVPQYLKILLNQALVVTELSDTESSTDTLMSGIFMPQKATEQQPFICARFG
jgi:hypothetical protein